MASSAIDFGSSDEQSHLGQVSVGHHARGIAILTMRGEHDISTQPVLARALELSAAHSNVVVDLSECSFVDSTVIREFVKTSEMVRADGERVVLVVPPEQTHIVRIAKLVGLAEFLEMHDSKDAALASLEAAMRREERAS